MIDLDKAKEEFKKYTNSYDQEDGRISLKINHTYGVVDVSKYIATSLELDEEHIKLAMLIGLLHDIGRFDQAKQFNNFEDYKTLDHAELGVDILFKKNLIRKFIETDKYDNIIYKAIINHNKYEIDKDLNEIETLYAKIIRDADKLDNFRVKQFQSLELLCNEKEEDVGKTKITEKIFDDFMNYKTIISSERKTPMDNWVSYIAFLFDINFTPSFQYIKEKDYIMALINRIKYIDFDTISKMKQIKECALNYLDAKLENK